eukprot:c47594_g1_i1 orf=52-288(-)
MPLFLQLRACDFGGVPSNQCSCYSASLVSSMENSDCIWILHIYLHSNQVYNCLTAHQTYVCYFRLTVNESFKSLFMHE